MRLDISEIVERAHVGDASGFDAGRLRIGHLALRFYVWYADFAQPATLTEAAETVIGYK